jgi:hypothetical protein
MDALQKKVALETKNKGVARRTRLLRMWPEMETDLNRMPK